MQHVIVLRQYRNRRYIFLYIKVGRKTGQPACPRQSLCWQPSDLLPTANPFGYPLRPLPLICCAPSPNSTRATTTLATYSSILAPTASMTSLAICAVVPILRVACIPASPHVSPPRRGRRHRPLGAHAPREGGGRPAKRRTTATAMWPSPRRHCSKPLLPSHRGPRLTLRLNPPSCQSRSCPRRRMFSRSEAGILPVASVRPDTRDNSSPTLRGEIRKWRPCIAASSFWEYAEMMDFVLLNFIDWRGRCANWIGKSCLFAMNRTSWVPI